MLLLGLNWKSDMFVYYVADDPQKKYRPIEDQNRPECIRCYLSEDGKILASLLMSEVATVPDAYKEINAFMDANKIVVDNTLVTYGDKVTIVALFNHLREDGWIDNNHVCYEFLISENRLDNINADLNNNLFKTYLEKRGETGGEY